MNKTKEKPRSGVAHFSMTGEFLTERARDCVASDMLGAAFRILDASNVPHELIIEVMTGTAKITGDTSVGDHTLMIEPDDATEFQGMKLGMADLVIRMERKFREKYAELLLIRQRIDFFTNLMNGYGGDYRRGKSGCDAEYKRSTDLDQEAHALEQFELYKENLMVLYKAQGKDESDLNLADVRIPPQTWMYKYDTEKYFPDAAGNIEKMFEAGDMFKSYLLTVEPDDIKAKYADKACMVPWHEVDKLVGQLRSSVNELPVDERNRNMRALARRLETAVEDVIKILSGWYDMKDEEKLAMLIKYRGNVKSVMTDEVKAAAISNVLDKLAAKDVEKRKSKMKPEDDAKIQKIEDDIDDLRCISNREPLKPYGLDREDVTSAWIAPNGDFYGREGSVADFIHMDISADLLEDGVIPENRGKDTYGEDGDNIDPCRWLEVNGWIKISQNRLLMPSLWGDNKSTFTRDQRDTVKAYYRNRGMKQAIVGMKRKFIDFDGIDTLDADYLMGIW